MDEGYPSGTINDSSIATYYNYKSQISATTSSHHSAS